MFPTKNIQASNDSAIFRATNMHPSCSQFVAWLSVSAELEGIVFAL
jgi:hypothetical protein